MASEYSASPTKPSRSALRTPERSALSSSASNKGLTNINEQVTAVPPIPRRSSRRKGAQRGFLAPWLSSRGSHDTTRTAGSAPPAYEWRPTSTIGEEEDAGPVESEKLAALRSEEGWRRPMRGGFRKLWLLIGLAFMVVVALAIGLGVGLSQNNNNSSSSGSGGSTTPSGQRLPPQKFPLGQYSFVTALMTQKTACASNPGTWQCYPYTVFDPASGGSDTMSLASYNWIINNTETAFASPKTTKSTPGSGVPANLTVASNHDIFGFQFDAKPLTYIASSSNSTSPRYTFSFTISKKTVPNPPISDSTTECIFDDTTFAATIYLDAERNYPSGSEANSKSVGGFEQWPQAVEITQTTGGKDVPSCFKTMNGKKGAAVKSSSIHAMPAGDQCLCEYRNYY